MFPGISSALILPTIFGVGHGLMRAGPSVQTRKFALLAFSQRISASGFVHFSLENREKTRSVVQTAAPCPQRKPSEAKRTRSGPESTASSQGSAFLMLLRPRMIGIEEQVRVDEDHR